MARHPGTSEELIKAIDLALGGDWHEAHRIVQAHEDDRDACWIHAALHLIEGDKDNAKYWYRKAGKGDWVSGEGEDQLKEIREALVKRGSVV